MYYKYTEQFKMDILFVVGVIAAVIALHFLWDFLFQKKYLSGKRFAVVLKCCAALLCGWVLMKGANAAFRVLSPRHLAFTEQLMEYNPYDDHLRLSKNAQYFDEHGEEITYEEGLRLFEMTHDVVRDENGAVIGIFEKGAAPLGVGASPTATQSAESPAVPDPGPQEGDLESVPDPAGTETPPESPYLLPDSDWRLLTEADLQGLGHRELCLARNEIFARHGRIFQTPALRDYFSSQSWYDGRYSEVELSEIEKQNVDFIRAYEDAHFDGSYY